MTEPGQEIQFDFSSGFCNKYVTGEPHILIGIDRYNKWPVVQICKSTETKEVIKFLKSFMNFYGVPEKVKSDKGSAFTTREVKLFCENWIIEINYSSPRLHTGTGAVERAMQTLKNLNNANLEDKIGPTENINRALRVMRFTIHIGLKVSPFELHHGRKPGTKTTNIIKGNNSYPSDWTTLQYRRNRYQYMWPETKGVKE